MKLLKTVFCAILFPVICFAHGVMGTFDSGGVVVTALYDDGEPLNYAETKVFAPDGKLPFSTGWTDRNGRFCFYPDVQGEFTVVIKDGMGHQVEMKIPASAAEKNETASIVSSETPKQEKRPEKMLLGLSVLFFLFGGFFWWKGNGALKKRGEN